MLWILVAFTSLLGLLLLVDRWSGLQPGLVPLVGLGSLVCTLYLAALAGALLPVTSALFFAGLLAVPLVIGYDGFAGRRLPPLLASPAGAYLIAVGVLFAFATVGAAPSLWDDYSHWNLARKELLRTHALWDRSSIVSSQDYPPGAALFLYFAGLWTGGSESGALAAHDWLILFPLSTLFAALRWRHVARIGLIVASIWYVLDLLGVGYQTLLVDHLLSAWLAALVAGWYGIRRSGSSPLLLAPALAATTLFKGTGLWFAAVPLAVAAIDSILLARSPGERRLTRKAVLVGLALAIAPAAAQLSWRARVAALELRSELAPVSSSAVLSDLGPGSSAAARSTREEMWRLLNVGAASRIRPGSILWDRLTVGPGLARTVPMSTFDWLWLLVPLLAYRVIVPAEGLGRPRAAALLAVLLLGLVAHTLGMLIAYLRVLPTSGLPSFGRYMNSYFACLPLLAAFTLLGHLPVRAALARWEAVGALALLSLGVLFQTPSGSIVFAAPRRLPFREERAPEIQAIRREVPEESRIGVVYRGARQFHLLVVRHDLSPRSIAGLISFTTGVREVETTWSDSPRLLLPLPAFLRWLSSHDYIYLARTNDRFWREYGEAFPASAESSGAYLYRVDRLPSDMATLSPVLAAPPRRDAAD